MLEQLSNCPICNSQEFNSILESQDHLVSREQFTINKCTSCKFVFTNPRPDHNSIVKYYKSDSYISHANKSNSIINILYKAVRTYTLRKKLSILESYTLKGNLLDYGCGTGHFLSYASSRAWQIGGVEPDPDANKIAQSQLGKDSVYSDLRSFQKNTFDAITLFHVLEHIHSLTETLEELVGLLKSNGILLAAVPNHLSYDASHYQSDWAAYDVPRHLYHFDGNSIDRLSEKVGLKVVAQLPMIFDSYYVSLLSERNKKSTLYPIKGFYRGLISNLKAKSNKQYSSLIYVLQKK